MNEPAKRGPTRRRFSTQNLPLIDFWRYPPKSSRYAASREPLRARRPCEPVPRSAGHWQQWVQVTAARQGRKGDAWLRSPRVSQGIRLVPRSRPSGAQGELPPVAPAARRPGAVDACRTQLYVVLGDLQRFGWQRCRKAGTACAAYRLKNFGMPSSTG